MCTVEVERGPLPHLAKNSQKSGILLLIWHITKLKKNKMNVTKLKKMN